MKHLRVIAILSFLYFSLGSSLFGSTLIAVPVKDSYTKSFLDTVTIYLIKDRLVIDYTHKNRVITNIMEEPWIETDIPHFFYTEEKGKMDLLITSPRHVCKVVPIEISSGDDRIELDDVYLDNIIEPDNPDNLIPKEKRVVKAVHYTDSFNIDQDSKLRDLIRQLPDVTLDERGQISLNGEPVEGFQLSPIGRYAYYLGDPAEALDIPARFVSGVTFCQNELRNDFRNSDINWKRGPLTMQVYLKRQHPEFDFTTSQEKDGFYSSKTWAAVAIVIITMLSAFCGFLLYRNKKLGKEVIALRETVETPEDTFGGKEIDSFRDRFVRANMYGASDNELNDLEDFVKEIDPDFHRSMIEMNLKGRDFYDAMLIRLGVGLSECSNILKTTSAALSMKRLRMLRNVDDNRGQEKWEDFILSFSYQKN